MNIKEIQSIINRIQSLDLGKVSVEKIRSLLEPLSKNMLLITPIIDNTQSFYRCVKLENKPQIFTDIIYPPKQLLKSYQRLNKPHCPVFYCSTSYHAAVFEGRYAVGDFVTISQWEVIEGKNLATTNVGYTEHLKKWSNREKPEWHPTINYDPRNEEEKRKDNLVLDFLSKSFCQNFDNNNFKYKLSIAISNVLGFDTESETTFEKIGDKHFEGTTPMEALVYPSILMNAEADNLAIRRDAFHKKLKFISADYIQVLEISQDILQIEEIDFSNELDENGNILWKGRKGNYVVPPGVAVIITKVAENEWNIERKDGGKLYKH